MLAPEALEAALREPQGPELRALRERVARHEQLAWLCDALVPLSAERQERIMRLAEEAFGVVQPDGPEQKSRAEQPSRAAQPSRTTSKTRRTETARRRWWPWLLIPLAATAAAAVLLLWPGAEPPPRYALETRIGDDKMMSPGAPSPGSRVSLGSQLQLELRTPAFTQLRPAILLFAGGGKDGDGSLRHVTLENVAWSEGGSARIRAEVAQVFPNHEGPARLLLVVAPEGTSAQEVSAQLRSERSWPATWQRHERSLEVVR